MTNRVTSSSKEAPGDTQTYMPNAQRYLLWLCIAGSSPHSGRAITNIRIFCEEHLKGFYDLEIHDISENPGTAVSEQIIAAPTLIRKWPLPLRRLIGDMSQTERMRHALDIPRSATFPVPQSKE